MLRRIGLVLGIAILALASVFALIGRQLLGPLRPDQDAVTVAEDQLHATRAVRVECTPFRRPPQTPAAEVTEGAVGHNFGVSDGGERDAEVAERRQPDAQQPGPNACFDSKGCKRDGE